MNDKTKDKRPQSCGGTRQIVHTAPRNGRDEILKFNSTFSQGFKSVKPVKNHTNELIS